MSHLPPAVRALFPAEMEGLGFRFFANLEARPFDFGNAARKYANAAWCAELALLAYADDAQIKKALPAGGLTLLGEVISYQSHRAFLVRSGDTVFVVFRGTELPAPDVALNSFGVVADVFGDWTTNFHAIPVQPAGALPGKVHQGFYEAAMGLLPTVKARLPANAGLKHFVFTGHSLGGALAFLTGALLKNAGPVYPQLITFGAPRAGDQTFVDAQAAIPHARYVNGFDVVVRVPWTDKLTFGALPGYVHHGIVESLPEMSDSMVMTSMRKIGIESVPDPAGAWHIFPTPDQFALGLCPAFLRDHAPILYLAQCLAHC